MLTTDDLSAIKKIVKEETQGVEERQAEKDNGLEKRFNIGLQGVEERLGEKVDTLRGEMKGMEARLDEKISKVQETVEIVQNVQVKHHSKLELRVSNIEEELRNPRN